MAFSWTEIAIRFYFVLKQRRSGPHYNDIMMTAMASQITGVSFGCPTVGAGADKNHKKSAALAFVWGMHRWFDDVIMHFLGNVCYVCPTYLPPRWDSYLTFTVGLNASSVIILPLH